MGLDSTAAVAGAGLAIADVVDLIAAVAVGSVVDGAGVRGAGRGGRCGIVVAIAANVGVPGGGVLVAVTDAPRLTGVIGNSLVIVSSLVVTGDGQHAGGEKGRDGE